MQNTAKQTTLLHRLLRHTARKRDGLILRDCRAHMGQRPPNCMTNMMAMAAISSWAKNAMIRGKIKCTIVLSYHYHMLSLS